MDPARKMGCTGGHKDLNQRIRNIGCDSLSFAKNRVRNQGGQRLRQMHDVTETLFNVTRCNFQQRGISFRDASRCKCSGKGTVVTATLPCANQLFRSLLNSHPMRINAESIMGAIYDSSPCGAQAQTNRNRHAQTRIRSH
jgi:hypothetical protein